MSFPSAFFVLLLVPDFYLPLRTLGTKFHASMNSAASAQRIYELLDTPVATTEQQSPSLIKAPDGYREGQAMPSIQLCNITYAYQGQEGEPHPALHNVSITIEQGQTVALIGASGAGKSTIAHLLLRFIEPQQGSILVGATPLEAISPQVWRRQIGWMPQRPYLSHESIADNIRMGCSHATMEQIRRAAQQAQLHDFIQSLPRGYDTAIGERGARLSGGQIQRLALARIFLKDAPLLILDEATAHLDRESEEAVLESLQTFLKNRMALIIAHRLHTLQEADRVVLLEEGRVVADGPHETLLLHSPAYQRLTSVYQRKEAIWTAHSGVC